MQNSSFHINEYDLIGLQLLMYQCVNNANVHAGKFGSPLARRFIYNNTSSFIS